MSYPLPHHPQVPLTIPCPPPSSTDFPYPGLRRVESTSGGRGRALQATASFPAGSAVAVFPRPLLCLPDGDHARRACDWCLRPGRTSSSSSAVAESSLGVESQRGETRPSLCTRCRYAAYCDRKCQAAAWKAVHKLECPALCRVKKSVFGTEGGKRKEEQEEKWFVPTPVRAAMQLLLRLRQGDEAVRQAVGCVPFVDDGGGDDRGVLEANAARFREYGTGAVWDDLGTQARAALRFAGLEPPVSGREEDRVVVEAAVEGTRRLLCALQTNAFDRRDEDVGAAGVFLDVDLAMANHSCVPNAYVVFAGRTAVLRAERDIAVGEEVEISYIDNTLPKKERHEALRLYHFECQCRRCRDDLDVYQVCQSSPTIPLNIFSLQPDLELYRNPPINRAALQTPSSPANRGTDNQHKGDKLWDKCRPLLEAKAYAIEPLPSAVHSLVVRYQTEEHQNFAYALCLACFLATRCHPYAHPAPFQPWRVKGLMVVAQLLSQTAPLSAAGELARTCPNPALVTLLERTDQVSVCEAVLRLVVHWGPVAHSDGWEVARGAAELLEDIAQLRGRERESNGIRAWAGDPERTDARAFVEEVVLRPVEELAGFALDIICGELSGGCDGLVLTAPPKGLRRLVYRP